jgi:cytidine deaminase
MPNAKNLKRLQNAARKVFRNAHCPYSGFGVGAAVLTDDGHIFSGSNVENASFGLTICAERNAIFQCVSKGYRRIKAVAVYTPTESPIPPCGACRQVISEFNSDVDIYCFCKNKKYLHFKLNALLPHSFTRQYLK